MPIKRAHSSETTAFGAALAASIGASLSSSDDVVQESHAGSGYVFSPVEQVTSNGAEAVKKHYAAWRRAVALCIDVGDSIAKDAIGI
jgi:glycerol kinase